MTLNLRENNPYSIGTIVTFGDNDVALDRGIINYQPNVDDRYYELVLGNNLSDIAHEAYGDSKYWWLIFAVNDLYNPFEYEVSPGKIIVVPDLERIKFFNP